MKEKTGKTYQKSYKLFILWLLAFVLCLFLISLLPTNDIHLVVDVIMNYMTISIAVLTLIIYCTENIYWYNGTTYEEANEAGAERRRKFALAHFKRFLIGALVNLCFCVISYMLGFRFAYDIIVGIVVLVGSAISTIKIKL